jgi:PAS domain S-box-containing protein
MKSCDQYTISNVKNYKILIVEDSKFLNKTIFDILSEKKHYSLAQAFDFQQASEFIQTSEEPFDFIILDLNLPDAYGEELVNDIKNLTKAKLIILTAEADKQIRESLFKSGILDYIVKDNQLSKSIKSINITIEAIEKNTYSNVLLIDDSVFMCKQIEKILAIRNYTSITTLTAEEGLKQLSLHNINLIILDMELPDRHGLELLTEIKEQKQFCHIPVIILSGNNDPELVRDCLKSGASDFISKPFNIEEFTLKVDLSIENNRKHIEVLCKQKLLDEYKLAIDDSTIVSKTDTKGRITYVNDKFCDISGYTREELLGQPHNIVRHPDMPASAFKEMWEKIQNKQIWSGVVQNLKKDGTSYFVQSTINPIIDHDGNIVEYIGIRTDVTELNQIKQELEENLNISNKNFQQAYKISQEYQKAIDESNIVSRTDKDGVITFVNDMFCKISGYSQEELLGKKHNILRSKKTSKKIYQKMWETITQKKIWHGQLENKAKDGTSYFVESTIVPILDDNENIVEYLGIRHNVTDIVTIHKELELTQKEIIYKMGEVGESRSQETGNHVKRVAEYSKLLARLYGLGEKNANLLHTASPMHDIGKVAIPDSILKKPGKLTDEEWVIMKTHSEIGYKILKNSSRPILKAAAIVAYRHHEKWDGSGYPNGLKGEKIHIFGRITALADVFDALGSDRCYKKAWELERILNLFKEERGKHFDPKLVDLFLENLDKFLLIRDKFQDNIIEQI